MAVRSMMKFLICLQKILVAVTRSVYTLVGISAVMLTPIAQDTNRVARFVLVSVDHTQACEASSCFQYRHSIGIANHLGIIVVDKRGRDNVYSCREVHYCRRCRGRGTCAWSTTISIANSHIDSCSIVCHAISKPTLVTIAGKATV